jgi:hypothetical protein
LLDIQAGALEIAERMRGQSEGSTHAMDAINHVVEFTIIRRGRELPQHQDGGGAAYRQRRRPGRPLGAVETRDRPPVLVIERSRAERPAFCHSRVDPHQFPELAGVDMTPVRG